MNDNRGFQAWVAGFSAVWAAMSLAGFCRNLFMHDNMLSFSTVCLMVGSSLLAANATQAWWKATR